MPGVIHPANLPGTVPKATGTETKSSPIREIPGNRAPVRKHPGDPAGGASEAPRRCRDIAKAGYRSWQSVEFYVALMARDFALLTGEIPLLLPLQVAEHRPRRGGRMAPPIPKSRPPDRQAVPRCRA